MVDGQGKISIYRKAVEEMERLRQAKKALIKLRSSIQKKRKHRPKSTPPNKSGVGIFLDGAGQRYRASRNDRNLYLD